MSRLDDLGDPDRRTRVAVGGAVGFVGVLLLVVGWYLISGEAVPGKQLPYLASASIPGAVLAVCGVVIAVSGSADPDMRREIADLHALLTEAVAADGPETAPDGRSGPSGVNGMGGLGGPSGLSGLGGTDGIDAAVGAEE